MIKRPWKQWLLRPLGQRVSTFTTQFPSFCELHSQATLTYARSYSLSNIEDQLKSELAAVERRLVEISEHVGAGL